MTLEEIRAGESQNLEFKVDIPAKSEKYMKTVVAFANGNGGRIVFGVEDQTLRIVGFEEKTAMQKIDDITNAIWDSCEPKIRAEVYSQVVDGKNIIVAEIPKRNDAAVQRERTGNLERNLCAYFRYNKSRSGLHGQRAHFGRNESDL